MSLYAIESNNTNVLIMDTSHWLFVLKVSIIYKHVHVHIVHIIINYMYMYVLWLDIISYIYHTHALLSILNKAKVHVLQLKKHVHMYVLWYNKMSQPSTLLQ